MAGPWIVVHVATERSHPPLEMKGVWEFSRND